MSPNATQNLKKKSEMGNCFSQLSINRAVTCACELCLVLATLAVHVYTGRDLGSLV